VGTLHGAISLPVQAMTIRLIFDRSAKKTRKVFEDRAAHNNRTDESSPKNAPIDEDTNVHLTAGWSLPRKTGIHYVSNEARDEDR
jgi:hypothetical protein